MHSTTKLQNFLQANNININLSESDVQTQAASILRREVIKYLGEDKKGIVAKSFRGEFLFTDLGDDYNKFLEKQSGNGVWGTYIEATAYAEMIGVSLVVTPVTGGVKQKPICLHKASDPNAPTLHLYNSNNTHWYVNSQTKGDGNCLYNSLIQATRALVRKTDESLQTQAAAGFFPNDAASVNAIEHQKAIADVVACHSTPAELEQMMALEKIRISRLSPEEQKQIADDYRLALRLAIEEIQNPHRQNIFVGADDSAAEKAEGSPRI